jgi:hypothetical protein
MILESVQRRHIVLDSFLEIAGFATVGLGNRDKQWHFRRDLCKSLLDIVDSLVLESIIDDESLRFGETMKLGPRITCVRFVGDGTTFFPAKSYISDDIG